MDHMFGEGTEEQYFMYVGAVRPLCEQVEVFENGFHVGHSPFCCCAISALPKPHKDAHALELNFIYSFSERLKPLFNQWLPLNLMHGTVEITSGSLSPAKLTAVVMADKLETN